MIARRICPALPMLIAILVTSIPSRAQMSARIAPADILIVHAKVYALNRPAPWAQVLGIRRGKIVAVSSNEVVGRMRGTGARASDAGGKLVLPGFTDGHVHFLSVSLGRARVNLGGASNTAGLQNRLREYANGAVVRDPQTGDPTGARKESRQRLVCKIIPKPSRVDKLMADRAGIRCL